MGMAFDAKTGKTLWDFELPPFQWPTTKGDNERLVSRYVAMQKGSFTDPICLPDSSSQPVLDSEGTAFQAWQDGKLYAINDRDEDGVIDAAEVKTYDMGDGSQGSVALAPNFLAIAPCGGGMHVWRTD